MGRIAAGQPIEAVETPETISLSDITRSKDVFVLQVKGESMKGRAHCRRRLRPSGENQ